MLYVVIAFPVLESGCHKNLDSVSFMNAIFEEEKITSGSILDTDFDNGSTKSKLNTDTVEIYGLSSPTGSVETLPRPQSRRVVALDNCSLN